MNHHMFVPKGPCAGANLLSDVGCITAKAFRDWKHLQATEGNATFKTDDDDSGTHKVFELGI
jgi:hypothetical protein